METNRKKIIAIISMLCLSFLSLSLKAAPAYPKPIEVKQPDGQIITIRIHFITTVDGYLIIQNKDGYYVYLKKDKSGKNKTTKIVTHDQGKRTKKEIRFLKKISKENIQIDLKTEEPVSN